MIEIVIPTRDAKLAGNMSVKRILPFRAKRMVGPFIFLDHMGPITLKADVNNKDGDVPPHPHIGLETVTYLFEGSLMHRDSLGTELEIKPGDVNWMTAGSGIVHSERIPNTIRESGGMLNGLQSWIALPVEDEDCAPSFVHYDKNELPEFLKNNVNVKLIAGSMFGKTSPVKTHSKLFYFETHYREDALLNFDPGAQECAMYLIRGKVTIDQQNFDEPCMVVFKPGTRITVQGSKDTHAVFLGGDAFIEPRHIWWNFVSSSKEKIEQAKTKWEAQTFGNVPNETTFIPLPNS